MEQTVSFIYAEICAHNNWRIIENFMNGKIKSNINIVFVTFCEMYFYKGGKTLKSDWVGILHDPDNTEKYYKDKNIFKNKIFVDSLSHCKGLFCMSEELKEWVCYSLTTNFNGFIDVLYHPISSKNLKEFNINEYKKNKCIIQIGNWLRKTYSIYKIKTDITKEILPYTLRTQNELTYFLRRDGKTISNSENNSVIKISKIPDQLYNNIFFNKIIFLDLYSSTANNVIMECIKSNNPIIINRLNTIEKYLGFEYPLFYDNIDEVTELIKNDGLILKAHLYLKNMNKERFYIENFIDKININIMKIN